MKDSSAAAIILGSGKVNVVDLEAQGMDDGVIEKSKRESEAIAEHMSPPGALGLPPLLEARRLSIGLIDELFAVEAVYSRLLLYQLFAKDMLEGKVGTGSRIHAPEYVVDQEHREAPRMIIISAGTDALDYLRSHGMDVGHIVTIAREAPYGIRVAFVGGKKRSLMIVEAGDVCASEDLSFEMRAGRCESFYDTEENTHKLRDPRTGDAWSPEFLHEDRVAVEKGARKMLKAAPKKAGKRKTPRIRQGF